MPASLSTALIRWFKKSKRDLPWRDEPRDPYRVWLSEVMLQQTQVATVIPYYERWLKKFPTLEDLANATLDDVLKAWEGLGYYSRARNFHKAAQIVMRERGGKIPDAVDELMKLPGIGRYTAGAIGSLAFHRHAPVLDGNVKRVLARLFVLKEQRSQLKTRLPYRLALDDEMWHLAESLLPKGRAGVFNEALMELGATVCLPRAPRCLRCPIRAFCKAFIEGNPEKYPIKTQKKQTPHKTFIAVILLDKKNRVLMGQRLMTGLLGGLWEFVCEEARTQKSEVRNQSSGVIEITLSDVRRVIRNKTGWDIDSRKARFLGNVKHAFTHFKMTKQVYVVHVDKLRQPNPNGYDQLRWVTLGEAKELALAQSEQKILAMLSG